MNGEILKLSKYICSFHSDIDADAYAEQLNMLYGAVYEMNAFIPIMFDEIVEIETTRIKANGVNIIKMINNVEMLIIEYSKIAFDLGRKSLYENRAFHIASALKVVFSELTSSTLIEKDMKLSLRSIISETELDLGYAAGNHNVASLRMAQLIREYKANNGGK